MIPKIAKEDLRKGDKFVVLGVDRLERSSLKDLIN